jgi:Raf kinase inhibitor-like YbhB/YbcL family protein
MKLTSPAFNDGSIIPKKYGYNYQNVNPPLKIENIPDETKSLVLIMDDPDALTAVGKIWVHWTLWNISPQTLEIDENSIPKNCIEGLTDFGEIGYGGPAPPDKEHTYIFKLYALDSILDISKNSTKPDVENVIKNHIITEAKLTGKYSPQ